MNQYTKPTCKGCYALGTACGKCERCLEESIRMSMAGKPVDVKQPTPERLQRHGANLFKLAESLGWKDGDSEGPLDFLMRRSREVGFEDAHPVDDAIRKIPNGWYLERMFCYPNGFLVSLQTYRRHGNIDIAQAQDCGTLPEAILCASKRARERDITSANIESLLNDTPNIMRDGKP